MDTIVIGTLAIGFLMGTAVGISIGHWMRNLQDKTPDITVTYPKPWSHRRLGD